MEGRPLEFVWSANRCSIAGDWKTSGHQAEKRLAKLRKLGFRLENIIGVDDTPGKYAKNYGNLVSVSEWRGDLGDDELLDLVRYLEQLIPTRNIRTVEKRGWRKALGAPK